MMMRDATEKVGKEWIKACGFAPLNNHQVLLEVRDRVKKTADRPTVLLDLDSTLYEVGPRSHQILREWLESKDSEVFHEVKEVLRGLKKEHIGYSLNDTFAMIGLSHAEERVAKALHSAKSFWRDRFFTNEYLSFDLAYDGAAEFVQDIYGLGAEIIYLTGRDEPGMGKGTRARLLKDGFPWEKDRTHLLLKKSFELDDLDHKASASEYVRGVGTLVASFENEPPNIVALSDIFPEAMHVFMDSVYSDRPATPKDGLYRITAFE